MELAIDKVSERINKMYCKTCGRKLGFIYLTGGFCSAPCLAFYPVKIIVACVTLAAIFAALAYFGGS